MGLPGIIRGMSPAAKTGQVLTVALFAFILGLYAVKYSGSGWDWGTGRARLRAATGLARAQAYPTRPVHVIVGFAAGGGVDITARLIGQWLSERLPPAAWFGEFVWGGGGRCPLESRAD